MIHYFWVIHFCHINNSTSAEWIHKILLATKSLTYSLPYDILFIIFSAAMVSSVFQICWTVEIAPPLNDTPVFRQLLCKINSDYSRNLQTYIQKINYKNSEYNFYEERGFKFKIDLRFSVYHLMAIIFEIWYWVQVLGIIWPIYLISWPIISKSLQTFSRFSCFLV